LKKDSAQLHLNPKANKLCLQYCIDYRTLHDYIFVSYIYTYYIHFKYVVAKMRFRRWGHARYACQLFKLLLNEAAKCGERQY